MRKLLLSTVLATLMVASMAMPALAATTLFLPNGNVIEVPADQADNAGNSNQVVDDCGILSEQWYNPTTGEHMLLNVGESGVELGLPEDGYEFVGCVIPPGGV